MDCCHVPKAMARNNCVPEARGWNIEKDETFQLISTWMREWKVSCLYIWLPPSSSLIRWNYATRHCSSTYCVCTYLCKVHKLWGIPQCGIKLVNNNNNDFFWKKIISSDLKFGWLGFFFKQVMKLTMECLVVVSMKRKNPIKSVDAFMRVF